LTWENQSIRGKTSPRVTLSTTNPTWTDPGSNPGLCGGRSATNRLSHGTAFLFVTLFIFSAWFSFCYARSGIKSVTCIARKFVYTFAQNKHALEYEVCPTMTSPLVIKTVKERNVYGLIRKIKVACVLSLSLTPAVTRRKIPFIQLLHYFCVMC
jgi:hypothetical protein